LAKQLREALSSVALNVAEGSDQRGARRTNHCAIALGSARESFIALRTAEAWGYIKPVPQNVVASFNQVIGTLARNVAPR
jgi:four helix bundle protein